MVPGFHIARKVEETDELWMEAAETGNSDACTLIGEVTTQARFHWTALSFCPDRLPRDHIPADTLMIQSARPGRCLKHSSRVKDKDSRLIIMVERTFLPTCKRTCKSFDATAL